MKFNRNAVAVLIAAFLLLPACKDSAPSNETAANNSAAAASPEESPNAAGAEKGADVAAEAELPTEPALWRWKLASGQSLSLDYRSQSDVTMEIPGMKGAMRERFTVNTEMDLHVRRILPDGRYDLEIPVRRMVIGSSSGQSITLDDLPEEVRVLRAYMTPLGKVEFYERIVVEVRDERVYGLIQLSGNGQGGTSTAGFNDGEVEVEVTASATIDPATGQVRLSGGVRERKAQPRTKRVEEEQAVQHIDVLPADILSLLELPEEPVAPGFRAALESPIGDFRSEVGEPKRCGRGGCGVLNFTVDGKVELENHFGAALGGGNPAMALGLEMDMGGLDMGMQMPDMGGLFGGGGGGAAAAAGLGSMSMEFTADITMLFDVAAGRTHEISGTTGSKTSMMGMETGEKTEFTLSISPN